MTRKREPYYKHKNIQEGDLVAVRGSQGGRLWVALLVTKQDKLNTNRTGLHLFGGFWYGKDPRSLHSYGKMLTLSHIPAKDIIPVTNITTIELSPSRKQINRFSLKTLKEML